VLGSPDGSHPTSAPLVEAERHVAAVELVVTRQRHVIDTIARGGHDTTEASALLLEFQGIHATTWPTGIGCVRS